MCFKAANGAFIPGKSIRCIHEIPFALHVLHFDKCNVIYFVLKSKTCYPCLITRYDYYMGSSDTSCLSGIHSTKWHALFCITTPPKKIQNFGLTKNYCFNISGSIPSQKVHSNVIICIKYADKCNL